MKLGSEQERENMDINKTLINSNKKGREKIVGGAWSCFYGFNLLIVIFDFSNIDWIMMIVKNIIKFIL